MIDILENRHDLRIISSKIEENSRILDLGCGDGRFLRYLQDTKNVSCLGMELDQSLVRKCIANGVPVLQSDLNVKLNFAEDNSFDYVILSHTLQELNNPDLMLKEIVRVGKKAIVSFINFGYIGNRFQVLFSGRMPQNKYIPHQWYNTPNIHLGTIEDFKILCKELNITIEEAIAVGKNWNATTIWPNLLAPGCVFILS